MALDEMEAVVGQNIRSFRKTSKLTQKELAKGIGVSTTQLRKYETGENKISAGKLMYISQMLDIPVHAFFQVTPNEDNLIGSSGKMLRPVSQSEKEAIHSSAYHLAKAFKNIKDENARKEIMAALAALPEI